MTAKKNNEIRLALEEVDPERAYELLAHNSENRNLRPKTLQKYTRDMKEGRWRPGAGEPIHITPEGIIGNGQHRLMAVVEADVTITLPFLYAPKHYRQVADQGTSRKFSDVLRIEYKEGNAGALAAMIRLLRTYRRTRDFTQANSEDYASIDELLATYHAEPNLRNSLKYSARETHPHTRSGALPAVAGVCHYIFSEIDPDEAEVFFERLQHGTGLEEGNPILALRRYFQNPERPRTARLHAALMIKAFNYWRQGKSIRNITWRMGGSRPEVFPTIDYPTS